MGEPVPALFCIPFLGTGGAERQLALLLQRLDRRRVSPTLAVFHSGGGLYEDVTAIADLPIHALAPGDTWSKWHLPTIQCRLWRLARRTRARVVFSYLPLVNTMALVAATGAGARAIWSIRASNTPWRDYGRGLAAVFRWEAWLSPLAGAVIANSQAGADYHLDHGYSRRTMRVVRNGVDTDRFAPNPEAGWAFRELWRIPPDATVVGQVGRFDPQKDWPTFLRTAALLAGKDPSLRFCCIGRDQDGLCAAMQALAAELGVAERTVFTGEVRDMPAAYNALDVCVLASAYGEGVPNAVAEAMACGKPCAVTDSGDAAWLVEDSRCVARPGDHQALAAAVARLLEEDAALQVSRGQRCRERVQAALSLDRLAHEVTAIIEAVA